MSCATRTGQALAYVYSRATETDALQAKVLTDDEARRAPSTLRGCRSYWGRKNESCGNQMAPA
jgi:hypothetical protein